jgi:DHA2 family multidrug resistance protein
MIYHTQSFGEMIQSNSPAYHQVLQNIKYFVASSVGTAGTLADRQSQFILMSHVTRQSFVQAIDDDFLLAAVITVICAVPVLFLKIGKSGQGKNSEKAGIKNQTAINEVENQTNNVLTQE